MQKVTKMARHCKFPIIPVHNAHAGSSLFCVPKKLRPTNNFKTVLTLTMPAAKHNLCFDTLKPKRVVCATPGWRGQQAVCLWHVKFPTFFLPRNLFRDNCNYEQSHFRHSAVSDRPIRYDRDQLSGVHCVEKTGWSLRYQRWFCSIM
jgi:hypothetical protein